MAPPRPTRDANSGAAAAVGLLLVTLLLPMLYCLSVGPAIWLVNPANVHSAFFEVVYFPLEWLYEYVEPLQPMFDWYLDFWR